MISSISFFRHLSIFFFIYFSFFFFSSAQPSWKQGVHYEIFVHSFCDSNKDGIGDIRGITSKLDYLHDLGVQAIWLTPIHPSSSYHKYDVMDYYKIDSVYGTMADFMSLIKQAHQRHIRVVMDLVINHTSKQHYWFQSALKDSTSQYKDYYVWTSSPDSIRHWYKAGAQRYYAFFWSEMPDLNMDNLLLREEICRIGRFWLQDIGVDGFRLDAAMHIYPRQETVKNYDWWTYFYKEMKKVKPDIYLVGEVWDKATVVAPYFKSIFANFNFDLAQRLIQILQQEKDSLLVDDLIKARLLFFSINPDFIDATFLSNHDQNRISSELEGNKSKVKLAASILFTLPGTPYVYYGEEIGMLGKKPDEHIREPFLWEEKNKDKNMISWIKPLYSDSVKPLSAQWNDKTSIVQHYKKLIHWRNKHEVLSLGSIEKITYSDRSILAFYRVWKNTKWIIIHNLSSKERSFFIQDSSISKINFKTHPSSQITNGYCALPPYSTVILE